MITAIWPSEPARTPIVVDSRTAILELAPHLERLAERCGQPGAMHWLPYFLAEQAVRRKAPLLVLLFRSDTTFGLAVPSTDLVAAALFSEYRFWGIRTGAVTTDDAVGFRSIIAPEGERAQVAALATRVLVGRGARIVLSTFSDDSAADGDTFLCGMGDLTWAFRQRTVGRALALGSTFEETLASLGKSTRFNMRYYRRRLLKETGIEFFPDAAALLKQDELDEINSASLNPVPPKEFRRRAQSASFLPGSFLMGIRGESGAWLSLAGGWRQNGTTVLHWQMNASGWEKYSIGTVMRSYLLEYEVSIGTANLLIHGGTAHSMRHAFQPALVTDLIAKRRGVRSAAMQKLARFFVSSGSVIGRPNYLAEILRNRELPWRRAGAKQPGRNAGLLRDPMNVQ